ncbi:Uncharacterized protein SCF082_LOCUS33792 [Durusdinium trenchii]|uniref:Uncharacterized protein n=1 Tax=Durusdinium trenchii TaxID=1381693 RepID=A0ABP0NS53_9DINO
MSCGGEWTTSKFYQSIRDRFRSSRRGSRKWLTRAEVYQRFGEEVGEQIIQRKQNDDQLSKSEIRCHPELPDNEDMVQYLVLVEDSQDEEQSHEIERLFECIDESDSSSSSEDKDKKAKKDKKDKKDKKSKSKKDTNDTFFLIKSL